MHGDKGVAARKGNQPDGDFPVQLLHVQRGGQCESAEKDINNRVGKSRQSLFGAHFGNLEQNGEKRHNQCGYRDMHGFGKPHNGNKCQDGQAFIDIFVIRQDLIKHHADNGGNDGDHQASEIGYRRLRAQ